MKLSRTVTYALHATMQLARVDSRQPVPCSHLAAAGRMPERFLLQILRNLVNHGILRSTRGVDGGYTLGRRPEEISLLDVIEAIDGPMDAQVMAQQLAVESGPDEIYDRLCRELRRVTCLAREELQAITVRHMVVPPGAPP